MAKKFYAVKKGRCPGIYYDWPSCQAQVKGFAGAEYKGFMTESEARVFMGEEVPSTGAAVGGSREADDDPSGMNGAAKESSTVPHTEPGEAVAYVDGSFDIATGRYACGAVLFYEGQEYRHSRAFQDPERALMRNVAGEIEGAMHAMDRSIELGAEVLHIYYDYEGIEKWCTGAWQTRKRWTAEYAWHYQEAAKRLTIHFHKVKGHSGDEYNDLADALARAALGL